VALRPAGIVNLPSGRSRSVAEVVEAILRGGRLNAEPVQSPRRKPCVHLAFDTTRLRQTLGDMPQTDFVEGLRGQYEHHLCTLRGQIERLNGGEKRGASS
jgi:nucleoside-diphosphate-sugar epimerase